VISIIFGSQDSQRRRYSKRDEVHFTTLLWQSNGRQNGLISRMHFFELCEIMVDKVTFVGFRGGSDHPKRTLGSATVNNKTETCATIMKLLPGKWHTIYRQR